MESAGWIRYLWPLFVLVLFHCKDQSKPEGLLNKQEMINLMVDIYLAEARISSVQMSRDSAIKLFYPYEDSLISRRGLSDSLLMVNYKYYLQSPSELESILDAVIDTLTLREQRIKDQP